jgi:hypothetical protein
VGTGRRGAAGTAVVGLALAGQLTLGTGAAVAAPVCQSSAPAATSITICVPDTTLTGMVPVTATVVGAVDAGGVRFARDGTATPYLLTDHDPDYAMALESSRLPNGSGTLRASTTFTDGSSATATVTVTVANAAGPPVPAPFSPRLGTPEAGQRFRLAAVGDGVDGSPASLAVAARIAEWDPDVFAYLGDVYDNGSPAEFDTWYGDANGYGRFRDITNPTVGNHEYRNALGAPYFEYWGGVPHYYGYDVGGWHVVVLDSTTDFALTSGYPSQLVPGSPQYDWLAADLAAHRGTCMLTYLHHPRYSNVVGVSRDGLSQVWSLLVDNGVAMVLAGHAHTYEHWKPLDRTGAAADGGMTQFVVGTGGREIQNPKGTDPRVAYEVTTPGALQLGLGPQDAAFAFVDSTGAVRDSGTVPCRQPAPPPDVTGPTAPAGTSARAASPTAATVSWASSADDVGVAAYTVRRGDAVVATLGSTSTAYVDRSLRGGTAYSWTVEASDAAGNRSGPSAPAAATTPFPTVRSRALLRGLRRAPDHRTGFTATRFPGWTDADGDRCPTRTEVLIAEAVRPPTVGAHCALSGGRWLSPYDGETRASTGRLVVDHLVPLAEAWRSGAHRWGKVPRRRFANDLGYPSTLVAVSRAAAADKAAREPQDWLPRSAYRCAYTAQWVAVKWRWRLAVDPAERRFLARRLTACGWPSVRVPGRAR